MKTLSDEEARDFIEEWTWGTIIAVDGDKPYAIEVSYGSDGKHIYCGSRPDGIMSRCVKANPNVIFKICDADKHYPAWRAGCLRVLRWCCQRSRPILYGMKTIAKRVIYTAKKTTRNEKDFEKIGEMLAANPETSSAYRVPIENISGRMGG